MRLTKSAQHFAVCHQSPWLKDFQLIPAQPDCQPLPPLPLKQSGSRVKGYHGAAFAKQRHLNNAAEHSKPLHLCICLRQASWYHFALLGREQPLGDRATFLTTGTHLCLKFGAEIAEHFDLQLCLQHIMRLQRFIKEPFGIHHSCHVYNYLI